MTWLFILIVVVVIIGVKLDDYTRGLKIRDMDKSNLNSIAMTRDSLNGMSPRDIERKMLAGGYNTYKKKDNNK